MIMNSRRSMVMACLRCPGTIDMAIPALRLNSDEAVAPVAKLLFIGVAFDAAGDASFMVPITLPHRLLTLVDQQFHMVMPHPSGFGDALTGLCDNRAGRGGGAIEKPDGGSVVKKGKSQNREKNRGGDQPFRLLQRALPLRKVTDGVAVCARICLLCKPMSLPRAGGPLPALETY